MSRRCLPSLPAAFARAGPASAVVRCVRPGGDTTCFAQVGAVIAASIAGDLVTTSVDDFMNDVLLVFAGPFTVGETLTAADAERSLLVSSPILAAADLEGDARPELIVGAAGIKTVWVIPPGIPPTGDPYAAASTILLGEGAGFEEFGFDVAAGDLDANGRDDLIVSTWGVSDSTIADVGKRDVGKAYVFYSVNPEIFTDGFESGDLLAWSSASP